MGHNELLLREALRGRAREQVVISVKFGALRDPERRLARRRRPARPPSRTSSPTRSRRLGTDYVDIYRPGRLDPAVPIEETVGAIAEMVGGRATCATSACRRRAPETLRRAHAVHPIADLQIEYSLFSRGIEDEILPACRELGVGITAYGVLSRGLLSGPLVDGRGRSRRATSGASCRASPARTSSATSRSSRRCAALRTAKGATVAQLAIAWVLSRGEDIVPLVGARRRDRLAEALGALDIALTADDVAAIERALPPRPWQATATTRSRWRCSTASEASGRPRPTPAVLPSDSSMFGPSLPSPFHGEVSQTKTARALPPRRKEGPLNIVPGGQGFGFTSRFAGSHERLCGMAGVAEASPSSGRSKAKRTRLASAEPSRRPQAPIRLH